MYKKKINSLVLGTNNQGKVREIKKLLPKNINLETPKKLNIKFFWGIYFYPFR